MEFSDQPHFSVAGVTDWTAVGGHGSDAILRTSESLASATAALKPANSMSPVPPSSADLAAEKRLHERIDSNPSDAAANLDLGELYLRTHRYSDAIHTLERASSLDPPNVTATIDLASAYEASGSLDQARALLHNALKQHDSPDLYRTAAEIDERAGDPLTAVRELEHAATLAATEQNYFEWGSDLLLHRAIWQAEQVFQKGTDLFPSSVRMQTGLGSTLFAGARYQEAAKHLCKASDLDPKDPTPYLFMGKVLLAAPNALPCIESKIIAFATANPENANATFLHAMALLKQSPISLTPQSSNQIETLLLRAVTLDPTCADAYLQLGILKLNQRDLPGAIEQYKKAIQTNPQLSDAYYRLAVAYDRMGDAAQAKEAFAMHDQLEQQQAAAQEAQRKSVKQFLFAASSSENSAPKEH
jgi:tetratricopeptide (TPR) repeat protein